MSDTKPRLTKFLADQQEAVQLARETDDGSAPVRVDAINAALSLAFTNASACSVPTTIAQLLTDARAVEAYLKDGRE